MSETCSLCLGGETDVPPFGTLRDAQDLIKPCSTCSLVVHKKCLFDWVNSLPSDKFHVFDPQTLHEGLTTAHDQRTSTADIDMGATPETTRIDINLSPHLLNQWLNNLTTGLRTTSATSHRYTDQLDKNTVLLLAQCPQCREDIIFSMRRSPFLASTTGVKTIISRGIQYSGVFLAFTSAITGIVSMGYIGLTSCGLKIMDSILPGPLLVQLLTKTTQGPNSYSKLSNILLGNQNYSIDNLEQALSKGLIDPFKFSRIPILPIILYRMRTSSIISCLFDINSKEGAVSKWITEFMLSGYISSLGNHELFRQVYANVMSSITNIIRSPSSYHQWLNIFRGVDFFKVNNLVSSLIPIRALYDLFFRLTLNRFHFDLTMNSRPREIANSLGEVELNKLEDLNSQITSIEVLFQRYKAQIDSEIETSWLSFVLKKQRLVAKLVKNSIIQKYVKLRLALFYTQVKTCIVHDYSTTFQKESVTIRALTTVIWPFISSKVGHILYKALKKMHRLPEGHSPEKTLLVCNIVGLVTVVFVKDLVNLYLSYKKANQLTQMSVINIDKTALESETFQNVTDTENDTFLGEIPGRYHG